MQERQHDADTSNALTDAIRVPMEGRVAKPRERGLTMVIDKGLGLAQTRDLLDMAAAHIDFIKLGFGTSLLYDASLLRTKLQDIKAAGIIPYPGGTSLEIAAYQGAVPQFLQAARRVGFSFIEVSDGTIDMNATVRRQLIGRARDMGFGVLSEVGKKHPAEQLVPERVAEQVEADMQAGAFKVIIEGRDAGRSIGIYDDAGSIRQSLFEAIVDALRNPDDIIWEAPLTAQQQALLLYLGPNTSFGNVQPEDVITLEATRVGLRGDTLRQCLSVPKTCE